MNIALMIIFRLISSVSYRFALLAVSFCPLNEHKYGSNAKCYPPMQTIESFAESY
jgi:hypothetical protein